MKPSVKPKKDRMAELREFLQIDRHALDEEIEQQPSLFDEVAEQAVLAVSRRDEAKWEQDSESVRAAARIRKKKNSEERLTENAIKEYVNQDEDYAAAAEAYLEAKKEADLWAAMRESFEQRGKMLRELAQLYLGGYFQLSSVGASKAMKRGIDRDAAEQAREKMSEQRRPLR